MLRAVAFVPSAPLLLPDLGGGPADLRAGVRAAVAGLTGRVVVVGAAPATGPVCGVVDATGFGAGGVPATDALPLALAVGTALLADADRVDGATLFGVGPDAGPCLPSPDLTADALLVVADGSARRTEQAPGRLDLRAAGFDRSVEAALAAGDPAALLALDADLAAELWVGGRPAWQAAAAATAGTTWQGRVHYAAAPYGVGYLVACWRRR